MTRMKMLAALSKTRGTTLLLAALGICLLVASGCVTQRTQASAAKTGKQEPVAPVERASACSVTLYGPEHMIYRGSSEIFKNACREVISHLSKKEQLDGNSVRYPHRGEGSDSHTANGRTIATKSYMKTKDDEGAEYRITTITLGDREPVVLLESTSKDRYKLINALTAEFTKRRIKVIQWE